MQPLSNDLRKRILDAVDNKEGSRRTLADRFKVNTSTITKLLQLRRETGSYEPRPHGGRIAPNLDDDPLNAGIRLGFQVLSEHRKIKGILGSELGGQCWKYSIPTYSHAK